MGMTVKRAFGSLITLLLLAIIGFFPSRAQSEVNITVNEIARLGRGSANSLDWNPDGKALAVASATGVWFYSQAFEEIGHLFKVEVDFLAWSPDGQELAVIDEKGLIQIWRISPDLSEAHLRLKISGIGSRLSWSPDGTKLVITNFNDGSRILDTQTGEQLLLFPNATSSMVWSPEGSRLVVANGYSGVQLWDAVTGDLLRTFSGFTSSLYFHAGAWSSDGDEIAGVTGLPTSLHVWNVETGNLLNAPDLGSDMAITSVIGWRPQAHELITIGGYVGEFPSFEVSVWDTQTWQFENSVSFSGAVRHVSWKPDGTALTVIVDGGGIEHWEFASDQVPTVYNLFASYVHSLTWSTDDTKLASSSGFGRLNPIAIWAAPHLENTAQIAPLHELNGQVIVDLEWVPHQEQLVTYSAWESYAHIERVDIVTGEPIEMLYEYFQQFTSAPSIDWDKDFSRVAVEQVDNTVVVADDIFALENALSFPVSGRFIRAISWSPDNNKIVTLSGGDYIVSEESTFLEVWDAATGERISSYEAPALTALIWSSDSSKIAVLVWNANPLPLEIHILNSLTGEPITTFEGSRDFSWHPESQILAVAATDGIRFWNVDTGQLITTVEIDDTASLAWSHSGRYLALGMYDGTTRIWQTELESSS